MPNADELWKTIERYTRILITSHVRPDGDALGSEIALALYLEAIGKECRVTNDGPLPERYAFLPATDKVFAFPEGADFDYEAVILLDAPDISRAGRVGSSIADVPVLIVDHHPYENSMADFAWIDGAGSSTGQMLYEFMVYRRELIDAAVATCLYTAMMTDTGRFAYANTSHRTLEIAADLVSLGADCHALARDYYENVTDAEMYLTGRAAVNMRRTAGGEVAWTTLSSEDFEHAGAGPEVAHELAQLPRSISKVKVGILIRDVEGKAKVSLRSKGGADVKVIAEHFGGGGHREAAGFLFDGSVPDAEAALIPYVEESLDGADS